MKTYYIQIDDCQNNTQAVVKVTAGSAQEARVNALLALHQNDSISVVTKANAKELQEDGYLVIDEDGEEVDLEDDD